MKPDGVATAALEPMETLESNPVNEAAPPTEQQPNQAAAAAAEEEMPQQPVGETGQGEPQANPAKGSPAAKTGSKTSGDPKAKATNKGTAKTKPSATSSPKTLSGPRSNTIQSRISNGTSKPQTNGVAKKAAPAAEKKSTPTSAPSKKPAGTAGAPISKSTSKVGEKKATGPAPATNAAKSTTGALAAKKTTSTAVNGVKPSTTAAAKKPPASRPGSAAPTKPSSAASAKSDKPPVAKTTRPTTATSASSRPATGSSLAAKTSATSRPAAPKTSAAKPPTPKTSSTTPSGGKAPASQTSRTTTPVKKDVTKPSTPGAKKPTDSPLSRPSSTTKSAKPETPKSSSKTETAAKKPSATKGAETKTPTRSKTQDSRPTPSKDASKTTSTKTAATKSSPKKTVGSSTPTPVKRGPKPSTAAEPAKEIAASVAAAAAIATAAAAIAGPGEVPVEPSVPMLEAVQDKVPETSGEPGPKPESVREPEQELVQQVTVQSVREPTPEPVREPTPEPPREPTPEPPREPTPEPVREPTPEPVREPTPEPPREPTPEPPREPTPEPMRVPTPEPMRVPTPEPMREPTPESLREPTPESLREPTPEPMWQPTPEPMWQPSPEPLREPSPEPLREPSPEPLREPSPEYLREPSPEPLREPSPEPVCRPTAGFLQEPEYLRELTTEVKPFHAAEPHEPSSQQSWETSPESPAELSQPSVDAELGADLVHHPASRVQMSSQMDCYRFEESGNDSVPSLGTTVMSPPCSPTGPASPLRQPHNASYLLEMDVKSDEGYQAQETWQKEEEDKENMFLPTAAPRAFDAAAQPHFLGTSPLEDFTPQGLISPHDKEEAVEKADQEINEDVDYDEEYDEEDEQRRLGHQLSSMITDMSMSQPSDELQARSSGFGGSAGWHGDDVLSGMDSEDISSCTSSRQQGVSDVSSTQHTAILEGTQSSDALVDSSLRGSEGDCNLMGSPNVETLANEEEDEDEDEERVDDMDMSSERVEEHHKVFRGEEQDDEEDEDVEMHSEGVTEACGNVEEDFTQEENLNLSHAGPAAFMPPASSWGQSNPFSDPWAQTASLLSGSSPSPMSDHGAADSETPTQPPAQARLDGSAPPFAPESEHEPQLAQGAAPGDGGELLAAPAVGMSQSSTLSGTALAAHSSSETSTPEELRDYDSSSGVESHSDKQQTPVPAPLQPDMEQDLGIHLEKGDGEEEEAETLPADEVLGTGPPTAPASNPSSPSTSGDEASDTEGEMQINDPEAPMVVDDGAGFESTTPTSGLAALDEDEEVGDALVGDCEEDGGGATPQSANSVASYGFDCTNSNSNAHSMAESCGKSPGIFSLENEEQLPEEAKDPSLIKELTLPSAAAAQAEDLLGSSVDLMPLGHAEDSYASWDDHRYLLGGKLEEADPLGAGHDSQEAAESQPAYYSTICDKTDSFLEGNV